ncbi:MAG: sigma-54-dependent transcriptional regulator [Flavobacteriales bacterium]
MTPKEEASVLVIEDQEEIQLSAKFLLRKLFPVIDVCNMPSIGLEKLNQRPYDVILLDMNFSRGKTEGEEGLYWLKKLMHTRPETVIVLMTAFGDVELAIKSIKDGAFDFILKPWNNAKFCDTLSEALRYSMARKKLKEEIPQSNEFVGSSIAWKEVMHKAQRVSETDVHVLITGESGSGKETVASFIHQHSQRNKAPMILVDFAAIPAGQMENELFGCTPGTLNAGNSEYVGYLERALEGTLVIHDMGLLSPELQLKLWTVIREKQFRPIGAEVDRPFKARIIATGNSSLVNTATKGQFNKELFYALATIEIAIPALRERGQDTIELAAYFLKNFREKYQRGDLQFSETAISAIAKYRWPGNVRELKQAVERAVILASDSELEPDDLIVAESGGGTDSEEHLMSLEEVEMSMIKKALTKHGGVISHAANELGLTRASLYRRLEKYGL